jgi:hypothetical protein
MGKFFLIFSGLSVEKRNNQMGRYTVYSIFFFMDYVASRSIKGVNIYKYNKFKELKTKNQVYLYLIKYHIDLEYIKAYYILNIKLYLFYNTKF